MEQSSLTARQMFENLLRQADRPQYAFGTRPMLVNVDLQNAYTRPDQYVTAYEDNPGQAVYVNTLADLARARGFPVVWTYVAFLDSGEDCGVFGSRDDHADSLQNIKRGSHRAALDSRLRVDPKRDIVINKLMPSAFHETCLQSLAVWHRCDTIIVTGGSTSGCVRATVVDSLSRGYRTIVPIECVADRHESPHFANLYDMEVKYAAVRPVAAVIGYLEASAAR